jgi:hypothetical protein
VPRYKAVEPRKIGLADSYSNPLHNRLMRELTHYGHQVYDYREPKPGVTGASFDVEPLLDDNVGKYAFCEQINSMPLHNQFIYDIGAIEWCDTFILLCPAEHCAHVALGMAFAWQKDCIVYMPNKVQPVLFYKASNFLALTEDELLDYLEVPLSTKKVEF